MYRCNESELPADCAFVIQFARRGFAGRAEHIASGRCTRFDNWDDLEQFVTSLLARVPAPIES